MSKRAQFTVTVGGNDISGALTSVLTSLEVRLKSGGEADTASFQIDDAGGRVVLPKHGEAIKVSLGWVGEGQREVFSGTVDEVKSTGSRSGGRTLSVSAKGFDTTGKVKDAQSRHWDNKTVKAILTDAATSAGVPQVKVDPSLEGVVLKYFAMVDETLLHMGRRLAQQIGGNFRIQGEAAVMAKRGGAYTPSITATVGDNLHSWDISPIISRARYGKIIAPWYDDRAAIWKKVEVDTGIESEAVYTIKPACADEADAKRQAGAMKDTSNRDAGDGSVTIEGNTAATPDALVIIAGARPGVDGSYRIGGVSHSLSRSGGFVTSLDLAQPQGSAGKDTR